MMNSCPETYAEQPLLLPVQYLKRIRPILFAENSQRLSQMIEQLRRKRVQ
jgi:hypothetical protein